VGVVLAGIWALSSSVFWVCVDDPSKILYQDWYTDTYAGLNDKITDYIDSIIRDYTYFKRGELIEPTVTFNECRERKYYKIHPKYDDVELVDEDNEIYNAYENYGLYKNVIFSGYMYNYTGKLYTFTWDTYMYIDWEDYSWEENIFINGSGYTYSGETEYIKTCEDTTYKLYDLYHNTNREVETPDYTYKSWRDYVLSNLCEIWRNLDEEFDCSTLFKDVDININYYNKGEESFNIKDVSYWKNTTDFQTRNINIDYSDYLTFFRATLSDGGERISLNSDMTAISKSSLIAWDSVSITWWINVQLPYTGCDSIKYTYKIYYWKDQEVDADGVPVFKLITADNFVITSGGVLYWVDADGNLINKDDYFYIPEENRYFVNMTWDDYWKKAVVTINEWVFLTEKWNYDFFLLVENELWEKKAIQLNILPIVVTPDIPSVDTSKLELAWYEEWVSYYPEDTIDLVVYLKDKYWNDIYDIDKWITVEYPTSNSSIQFLTNNWWVNDKATWLLSLWDIQDNPYFSTKFRFLEPGLYPMNFEITVPNKNSENEYDGSYTTIPLSVMDNWTVKQVYIEDPDAASSDFNISCTNSRIVLSYTCTLDNFSWCDPNADSSITFTSESDNGKTGFLEIRDNAGNLKQKYYSIEHIDQTAPTISFGLSNSADFITESSKTILATDAGLYLKISDYRPSGCSKTKEVKVFVNWVQKYLGNVDENEITILNGLFEKKWEYNITVSVKDDAWNIWTISKTIRVIPNNSYKYEFVWIDNGLYADWNNLMTFKFKILDSFNNLVERNDILDTVRLTSDSTTNELSSDFEDALSVKNYTLTNWILSINAVLYNKSKDNIRLGGFIKLKEVDPVNTNPYYSLKSFALPLTINVPVNMSDIKNLMDKAEFVWNELTVDQPSTMSFSIPITNCGKNDIISNLKVKAKLTFIDAYTNQEIDSMYIQWAEGYEDLVEDLQNEWLDIPGTFSCGDTITRRFDGLFTSSDWVPSPKIKLSAKFEVYYDLNWLNWIKNIQKLLGTDSELNINYWGVLVKWLFTNSSKGLYEMLRKWEMNMWKSAGSFATQGLAFNKILAKLASQSKGHSYLENNSISNEISWINKYNHDLHIWSSTIKWKALIYVKWGNVYIDGNIRKEDSNSILTIATIKDKEWNGWKIIIDPSVTNIDAILITNGGIYSYDNIADLYDAIKGQRNSELNNQLVIYWLIISKKNTIWWSIAMNNKYVLPGWKEMNVSSLNYYRAALFDLNFLRKYHYLYNKWNTATDPTTWMPLDDNQYWTNPLIIMYDSSIKTLKPYGF